MNLFRPMLAIAALMICSPGALAAQDAAEQTWLTDQNGCKVVEPESGRGIAMKATWDGACVDGFVSGRGTLRLGSALYTGEFKQGQIVSGKFVMGPLSFEGEFKGNLPDRGVMKAEGGPTVTGVFNKKQNVIGPAVMEWSDGSRYEGGLDDTYRKHGKGRVTASNGEIYEGEFQNDVLHGTGMSRSSSGASYTGQFAFGYREGQGTAVEEDGSRYEGGFKAGERHGQGRYTDATGGVFEGEWQASKLNGKCKIQEATGDKFEGTCLAGKPSGHGRLENAADESVYEGEFKNGLFAGQGTLTVGDASFKGEFKDGEFIRGVMHTSQGKTIELDREKQTYMEILKDGTKRPVDPSAISLQPQA